MTVRNLLSEAIMIAVIGGAVSLFIVTAILLNYGAAHLALKPLHAASASGSGLRLLSRHAGSLG
jgi:hypothetical protein